MLLIAGLAGIVGAFAMGTPHGQAQAPVSAAPLNCAQVAALAMPDVRITAADDIAPGAVWDKAAPAGGPPRRLTKAGFCRVQGVIEKEIGFELWLPSPGAWNGKFLGTGVGGDAGAFNYNDLPRGVDRGYAAATTDSGHKAADANWMLGDPARLTNFELRAHHLLAEKGKAIAAAYYGAPAKHSYFIGCSGGGRQGLKEVQRFPADYDGVIAGANGPKTPEMTTRRMWELLLRDNNPGLMAPDDWRLIQRAGIAACDKLDGVADGVAEDPRRCKLNLGALACRGAKTAECLTKPQIEFAQKFYAPMRDETGRALDGGLLPGVLVDSGRSRLAPNTFGQAVRKQSDWTGQGFSVKSDLAAIDQVMPELRADDTDIAAFRGRGGKLIMYQGWMDPAVAARMVIDYHEALGRAAGGSKAADGFLRLYMLPGVLHCSGGAGADQIGGSGADAPVVDANHDLLSALEDWIERGRAPNSMIASKVENGAVTRTHLICPYPQTARFIGGDSNKAENYRCTAPHKGGPS